MLPPEIPPRRSRLLRLRARPRPGARCRARTIRVPKGTFLRVVRGFVRPRVVMRERVLLWERVRSLVPCIGSARLGPRPSSAIAVSPQKLIALSQVPSLVLVLALSASARPSATFARTARTLASRAQPAPCACTFALPFFTPPSTPPLRVTPALAPPEMTSQITTQITTQTQRLIPRTRTRTTKRRLNPLTVALHDPKIKSVPRRGHRPAPPQRAGTEYCADVVEYVDVLFGSGFGSRSGVRSGAGSEWGVGVR